MKRYINALFNSPGAFVRIGNKCLNKKIPLIPNLIQFYMRVVFPSCDIPITASIGEGTKFIHRGIGVCVHWGAKIGKNNKIMQNVTIGGRNGRGAPTIGDYCFIGAGACVLGNIKIGNNVMIGANAVVINDVPDNTVVGGIPAKYIKNVDADLIDRYKE